MPKPFMHWQRLRRFFHLQGNLGGLRYEARVGIFELNAPPTHALGNESMTAPETKLLADSSASEPTTAVELQAWESEGGAPLNIGR